MEAAAASEAARAEAEAGAASAAAAHVAMAAAAGAGFQSLQSEVAAAEEALCARSTECVAVSGLVVLGPKRRWDVRGGLR